MYSGHVAELIILCVCVTAFIGYHLWLYNFDHFGHFTGLTRVPTTMAKCRQVWTRSMCMDEKETITAVQTLRNSLMTVTLFTVAAGYIGARAIPEILLDATYIERLNLIQVSLTEHCVGNVLAGGPTSSTLQAQQHKHRAHGSSSYGSYCVACKKSTFRPLRDTSMLLLAYSPLQLCHVCRWVQVYTHSCVCSRRASDTIYILRSIPKCAP